METQTTQTTETVTTQVDTVTQPVTTEVPSVESEGEPAVAVAVDGVEVSVTDSKGELEVTPVTGLVGALLLGLIAVAVVKLRGKK